jgi:hypothetical protein
MLSRNAHGTWWKKEKSDDIGNRDPLIREEKPFLNVGYEYNTVLLCSTLLLATKNPDNDPFGVDLESKIRESLLLCCLLRSVSRGTCDQ